MKKLRLLLVAVLAFTMLAGTVAQAEDAEPITITFLHCWNGGGANFPSDQVNNLVAQKLLEETGVIMQMESLVTSELERLNTMFASGVLPDLVNAPYWSTTSGEGEVIKDAASQGLLYDIKDLLPDYPNVQKLYEVGVALDYLEFDVYHPSFNGGVYVIPQQTPTEDPLTVTNWAYGVYARGDILDALGVNAEDITSAEALYDLAVQIRDGDFKDAAGGDVIPMGTWHNGWSYSEFTDSFSKGYFLSKYRQAEDGTVYLSEFDDSVEESMLFIRKLLADGLLDVECFSNTDTMAKEKFAIGKVAIFGAQSGLDTFKETLYQTNPEMEYRLLGPMINQNGDIVTQVEKSGRSGSPVFFINGAISEEKARAILRYIDYINSEEGKLLVTYGVEGETFTYNEDGIPVFIPELKEQFDADPKVKNDMGLNFYHNFIGADDRNALWPTPEDQKTYYDKLEESFRDAMPIVFIDKVSVEYLERDYPGLEEYQENISTLNWEDELRRAYFAESDEAALEILEAARQRLIDAGCEELCAYVQQKVAEYPDPERLSF